MPDPTAAATISYSLETSKAAISLVMKDIYELSKHKAATLYNRFATRWRIPSICRTLASVRKAKTLFQLEKEIDLKHFYHPSRLLIGKNRKEINVLSDIPYDGNLIIEGTVGQGKSTFLRFLTWTESTQGKYLPLFLELRKYDASTPLLPYIQSQLSAIGYPTDTDVLTFLLETAKIALFLDGFDEIAERLRANVITELEELARRYPGTRIIVTSRPDSDIQSSVFFRVVQLAPLVNDEYKSLIRRMTASTTTADRLIAQITTASASQHSGPQSITGLLTTPLMVALLVIKFNIEQSVPENLCDFYRDLFVVMLQRHDRSKAGFRRERASRLSDDDIQAVFDSLCFQMRRDGISTINRTKLRSLLKDVCADECLNADHAAVLTDITKITCLLLEDGGEFHFIHRSVLEFHAARFIYSQPDAHAKLFYQTIRPKWSSWVEEINFLSELDDYRFFKEFEIPDLEAMLQQFPKGSHKITTGEQLRAFTGDLEAEIKLGKTTSSPRYLRWIRISPSPTWTGHRAFIRRWGPVAFALSKTVLAKPLLDEATKGTSVWSRLMSWATPSTGVQPVMINLGKLFDAKRLAGDTFAPFENEIACLEERLNTLRRLIERKESKKTKFDFGKL